MCKYTYHHFPICGHISNWTVVSCLDLTHQVRTLGQRQGLTCDRVEVKHKFNRKASGTPCVQCDREWCDAVSHDTMDDWLNQNDSTIEGINADRPLFEYSVRINPHASSDPAEYFPSSRDTDEQSDVFADSNFAVRPSPSNSPGNCIEDHGGFVSPSPIFSTRSSVFTLSTTDKSTTSDPNSSDWETHESSDSRLHRHIRIRYRRPMLDWKLVNSDCDRVPTASLPRKSPQDSPDSPNTSSMFSETGFFSISSHPSSPTFPNSFAEYVLTEILSDNSASMPYARLSEGIAPIALYDIGYSSEESQQQGHSSPASTSSASSSSANSDMSASPQRFRSARGRTRTPYPRVASKASR
ncbi:uncharacterized protein N7443_002572 [Penicillium atrosanguineum]|uniref:uncharacterized protein n=1 Tax=Penicillium atrosanguineum TaxID=1132637 RepID=UPI0023A6B09E|nr:uncharacterized protein N7443_002572 [Penicillium atrosanguineum]KAJ5310111.1 hypothetical protein N7443_002572 [Penicillium atrosanguineum]